MAKIQNSLNINQLQRKQIKTDICHFIINECQQCTTRRDVVDKLVEKYNMTTRQAYRYIRTAYQQAIELSEKEIVTLKMIQLGRLEHLMDRALKRNDIKSAVAVIDTINKLYGLYDQKVKVEITKDVIQFKFANTPTGEEVTDVKYEEVADDIVDGIVEDIVVDEIIREETEDMDE